MPNFCKKPLLLAFAAVSLSGCVRYHDRQYPEINVRCIADKNGLELDNQTYRDARIVYSVDDQYFYIYKKGEAVAQYPSSCKFTTSGPPAK